MRQTSGKLPQESGTIQASLRPWGGVGFAGNAVTRNDGLTNMEVVHQSRPEEETADWRAVCGRTARTVRREGRVERPFPTPIRTLTFPGTIQVGRASGFGAAAGFF